MYKRMVVLCIDGPLAGERIAYDGYYLQVPISTRLSASWTTGSQVPNPRSTYCAVEYELVDSPRPLRDRPEMYYARLRKDDRELWKQHQSFRPSEDIVHDYERAIESLFKTLTGVL